MAVKLPNPGLFAPRRLATSLWGAALAAVLCGVLIGTATAFGPIYAIAGLLAAAVALGLLRSTRFGVLGALAVMTLLPFGTLPFKAIVTPTFLSLVLAALSAVWLLRALARADRYDLRLGPLGLPLLAFLGLTFFSLILGARGLPDPQTLHNYAKFALAVLFYLSMVNVVRSRSEAVFVLRALVLLGAAAALLGLLLWALPDSLSLQLLTALSRIGYPDSGRVLRYVEDDVNGLERVIGLAVDPNSFGGALALLATFAAAQYVAEQPILPRRWMAVVTVIIGVALLLTFSRAALFGLIIAAVYLAVVRYHRLWYLMIAVGVVGGSLLVALGYADDFLARVISGVQFEDQAQQMRLAEFANAVAIIQRYPWFGIGFGAAPDIDLTAGVSSIYLAIGQRMGLVGLTAFLALAALWFVGGLRRLPTLDVQTAGWVLAGQGAIVAALAVGLADHYFFNIEFSHMVALFWGVIGLTDAVQAAAPEPAGGRAAEE
jgi:polysaccharide biosynthesis protein PslJ